MEQFEIKNLLNLEETIAKDIFEGVTYPWEVLSKIGDFVIELGNTLDLEKFEKIGNDVWIAKSAKVAPTACIMGPCIIDEEAEIRHSAFIRGKVIIGKKAVVRKFYRIKERDTI